MKITKPTILVFTISLVLIQGNYAQEDPCQIDSDCKVQYECLSGYCSHKEIFPLSGRDYLGSILIVLLSGLSSSAGLGGSGLFTAVFLMVLNYRANTAVMILYGTITGGSLGNFFNVAYERHPKSGLPLVSYDLSLVVLPLMIMGASIGIHLNKMAAAILVIIGLGILTVNNILKYGAKAKQQYAQEQIELSAPLLTTSQTEAIEMERKHSKTEDLENLPGESSQRAREIYKEDNLLFPWGKIKQHVFLIMWILGTRIIRGNDKFPSFLGINYCSFFYWVFYLIGLAGCYYIYLKNKEILRVRVIVKERHSLYRPNEFKITLDLIPQLQSVSIIAGLLSGLLGIGGGMVLGPVLLNYGIDPQILAATTGFFVVVTSFTSAALAFLGGHVSLNVQAYFFFIAMVGSYAVSSLISYLIKKYKRPAILLSLLTGVMTLSLCLVCGFNVIRMLTEPSQMFAFRSLC